MIPPAEEGLDEAPDNPPQVPLHFINGYRGWHIVIDENGQEVIELVTSDEEEEGEEDVVADQVEEVDPVEAFWDIEMGPAGEPVGDPLGNMPDSSDTSDSDDDTGGVKEIGVQCNIWRQRKESDSSETDNELDSSSASSELSESDPGRPGPSLDGYVCGGRGRLCLRGHRSRPLPGKSNVR